MDVYTVISEFAAPKQGQRLYVGDTVGKLASRTSVLIGAVEYDCLAFWQWIGTDDSLNYLSFMGTVPDPSGGLITEAHGMVALTPSQDYFTLSGAAFGFVPTVMVCVVVKPTDVSDNIFVILRDATLTADGFTVDFSSDIPSAGYKLSYMVIL